MTDTAFAPSKIKNLILRHMSGPSPTCEERQIDSAEEWGLLKTTAITWNGWDCTAHKVPPKEYWRNSRIEVNAGDVLVTKAGPRHRVGVVVYVDETPPRLMVSGKMIGLRPDPTKVNYKVLAAALSQYEPQRFLDSRTSGMADSQLNFTNDLLLNTEVLLPPKPEQAKIAEILSVIDRAIEQTEELIAKQQRIKTGLMQGLLNCGVDEHGNFRSEQTHKFKDSPLGRMPVEWEPSQIGNVATLQRGHDITENELRDGPYPVVSSSGIIGYHIERTSRGPNVVVGRKGTIGKVHFMEHAFWAHDTSLYVTNFHGNNEKYFYYLFTHLDLARFGTKSGSPSLNRNDIHPLWIGLPSQDEQKQIVEILMECDKTLDFWVDVVSKLRSLKSALMQDLLTGKKRVNTLLKETTKL